MKKFFISLLVLVSTLLAANAISFNDAISQSGTKPVFIIVYAKWAPDYQSHLNNFNTLKQALGNSVNFVEIDISNPNNKQAADFNKKYYVYPNVPYVIMLRSSGNVCRYIPNECSKDYSCMNAKATAFLKK